MPISLGPILVTPASTPPTGEGWIHEAKLDGWRCLVQVSRGRVQVRSRRGGDYTSRLPELQALSGLRDVVLDGELVVVTSDGRADFELLSRRINATNGARNAERPVTLYAFDALRHNGRDLCPKSWSTRRRVLDKLNLSDKTSGVVQTVSYTDDGEAMHQATLAVGAEGTVSKKVSRVARRLGELIATDYRPTAPRSGANRNAAQRRVRSRKAAADANRLRVTAARERPLQPRLDLYACPGCGAPVSNPRHIRCEACIAADPRQTPTLRKSRGAAISARKQTEAAWQGAGLDPDAWEKTIRPALATVGLSAIMDRLGVSKSSAWSWKVGRTTPHPSHWRALAELTEVTRDEAGSP